MLRLLLLFLRIPLLLISLQPYCLSQISHAEIQSWVQSTALGLPFIAKDTSFLHTFFENRRIVCIGEATHGTSDIYIQRHYLSKYLIEHEGFNCIAIEAPMTEIESINQYILGISKDTVAPMKHFFYFASRTEEMKQFVEWLREYNMTHESKIQMYGIDITLPLSVAKTIRSFFLRHKPNDVHLVDSAYAWYAQISSEQQQLRILATLSKTSPARLLQYMKRSETIYSYIQMLRKDSTYPRNELAWVLKNAEIMTLCLRNIALMYSSIPKGSNKYSLRDSCMAANALWILHQKDKQQKKMIIFAHNGHSQYGRDEDGDSTMGAYLKQSIKEQVLSISTGFYEGGFNAIPDKPLIKNSSKNGMMKHYALKSRKNSLEWYCHHAGISLALIPICLDNQPKIVRNWLSQPQYSHDIGATIDIPPSLEMQFSQNIPYFTFDAMLFINSVSASQILTVPSQ
jgi:erythromycin esterase